MQSDSQVQASKVATITTNWNLFFLLPPLIFAFGVMGFMQVLPDKYLVLVFKSLSSKTFLLSVFWVVNFALIVPFLEKKFHNDKMLIAFLPFLIWIVLCVIFAAINDDVHFLTLTLVGFIFLLIGTEMRDEIRKRNTNE